MPSTLVPCFMNSHNSALLLEDLGRVPGDWVPRGRSHPRRFQLRTPDAPRGDGISSRSASPRQGVPRAGHCAATAATTTAATINATSARDSLASPWSPTPGPSHSQNRPSGRGLDHVPRDPSPGGNPESPDPARRPLTPRAPPLPERPRVTGKDLFLLTFLLQTSGASTLLSNFLSSLSF